MPKLNALFARIWEERVLFFFCFIIAFFAWQSIHRNIGHETTISDIYIETIDPAEWAVLNQSLQRVNITFQGSQEEIRFLDQEDLRVIVPLPEPGGDKETPFALRKVMCSILPAPAWFALIHRKCA